MHVPCSTLTQSQRAIPSPLPPPSFPFGYLEFQNRNTMDLRSSFKASSIPRSCLLLPQRRSQSSRPLATAPYALLFYLIDSQGCWSSFAPNTPAHCYCSTSLPRNRPGSCANSTRKSVAIEHNASSTQKEDKPLCCEASRWTTSIFE